MRRRSPSSKTWRRSAPRSNPSTSLTCRTRTPWSRGMNLPHSYSAYSISCPCATATCSSGSIWTTCPCARSPRDARSARRLPSRISLALAKWLEVYGEVINLFGRENFHPQAEFHSDFVAQYEVAPSLPRLPTYGSAPQILVLLCQIHGFAPGSDGIEIKGLVLLRGLRYATTRCCRDCRGTRRCGSIA